MRQYSIMRLPTVLIFVLMCGCMRQNTEQSGVASPETATEKSIMSDGIQRTYLLYTPKTLDKTKKAPLLIVLHGGGGDGAPGMERLTKHGFNALAEQEGFVVAYPNAFEKHWNDGRQSRWRASKENIDDVGFISNLIDGLSAELNIDEKRVYVTGASNGAMMSHRLACELSHKIAAFAPVMGAMPENLPQNCSPSASVPILMINGVADPLVPWEGGDVHFGPLKLGRVLSVYDTVNFWVKRNDCSPTPTLTWEPDVDADDGIQVRREEYCRGLGGSKVILYAVEGGGHTWPGGLQYAPVWLVGKTSRDINATEVIWDFLKKQRISD